jgi:type I restriction enzyme S subunit
MMADSHRVELPVNWEVIELGQIADIVSGIGFPKRYQGRKEGEIPVYKVSDISKAWKEGSLYLDESPNNISKDEVEGLRGKLLPPETIVFAKIGEALRLNRRAFISKPSIIDNNVMGLVPNRSYVVPRYLFYFFLQIDLGKLSRATAVPSVRKSDVSQIQVPLPPLNEQRRIVARIEELFSELDAGVAALEQARAQLKRYRQALLKAAFEGRLTADWRRVHAAELEPADVLLARIKAERERRWQEQLAAWEADVRAWEAAGKPGKKPRKPRKPKDLPPLTEQELAGLPELPEGWAWARVSFVSSNIQYGYTASATDEIIGPKFLRITDIQNNEVNWNTVPYCDIPQTKKRDYLLERGDIVFARTGATVGKSYLLRGEIPEAVFASYLIRVKIDDKMEEEYVAYFFHTPFYWEQISEGQVGIGQPSVNGTKLANLLMPIAPEREQHEIISELDRNLSTIDYLDQTIEQALARAAALRQAILQRAFSGRLVPQDSEDEPASELLARMRSVY